MLHKFGGIPSLFTSSMWSLGVTGKRLLTNHLSQVPKRRSRGRAHVSLEGLGGAAMKVMPTKRPRDKWKFVRCEDRQDGSHFQQLGPVGVLG